MLIFQVIHWIIFVIGIYFAIGLIVFVVLIWMHLKRTEFKGKWTKEDFSHTITFWPSFLRDALRD